MTKRKMKIEDVPIKKLTPWENNPRIMHSIEMDALARSIDRWGFVEPALIDEHNLIIGGHQRILAARSLGYTSVPCHRVTGLERAEKNALNIALNKIHGEWDEAKLATILQDLQLSNIDVTLTGFSDIEIELLFMDGEPDEKEYDENIETKNRCPKCGYEW